MNAQTTAMTATADARTFPNLVRSLFLAGKVEEALRLDAFMNQKVGSGYGVRASLEHRLYTMAKAGGYDSGYNAAMDGLYDGLLAKPENDAVCERLCPQARIDAEFPLFFPLFIEWLESVEMAEQARDLYATFIVASTMDH